MEAYMRKDAINVKDVKPTKIEGLEATRKTLLIGNTIMLAVAERKAGITTPVLKHDFEEIVYVVRGKTEMEYPVTGEKWIMEAGSAKLHPVGTEHRGTSLEDITVIEIRGPKIPSA